MKKILVIILISMLFSSSILFGNINQYIEENIDEQNVFAYDKRNDRISGSGALGDSWSMFGHNPKHTRYSSYSAPDIKILQWTFTTGDQVKSSPAVVDGKVYIGSYDKKLYCLDAETGAEIWNFTTGGAVKSSPAVYGGKVYVGSNDGKMYCLGVEDGVHLWNRTTNGAVYSSPTVTDGKVFIGSDDNFTYCFDADTGIVHWGYLTGGYIRSSPAVANGKVYVGSLDGMIYCLDADVDGTGETDLIWSNTTSGLFLFASPAIYNQKIYITNYYDYGKTHCFDAESGEEIWNISIRGRSSPAIADGKVYIGSKFFGIYCLNAENGSEIWNHPISGAIYESSPAVADGKVYIGTSPDTMYCLDAEDGREIWSHQTGGAIWSSPAIADGKVYFGSDDNKVYCIGNEAPETPDQPDGPTDGIVGVEYSYTTNEANDPDGHEVSYLFDWDDGETSGWIALPSASHSWDTEGTYWIKVKAKDTYGAESNWSDSLIVHITSEDQEIDTGFIYGIVSDNNANPIEGANVTISNATTIYDRSTNEDGQYYISVPVGTYTVKAEKQGYETSIKRGITVIKNEATEANFALKVESEAPEEGSGLVDTAIAHLVRDGYVAGTIKLKDSTARVTTYYDVNISIESISKNRLSFTVNGSEGTVGKVITVRFGSGTLEDMSNVSVLYDNESIAWVNFDTIFNADNVTSTNAKWTSVLAIDAEGVEILYCLIWVPHFSEHTITISSFVEVVKVLGGITVIIFYIIICVIAAIVFFSRFYARPLYLTFSRKKK